MSLDTNILLARIIAQLRAAMKDRNIRSAPLAKLANLNESAVRDIFRHRSRNPGLLTLAKIADALDISLHELVDGSHATPLIGELREDGRAIFERSDGESCFVILPPKLRRDRNLDDFFVIRVGSDALGPLIARGDYLLFRRTIGEAEAPCYGAPCLLRGDEGELTLEHRRANHALPHDQLVSVNGAVTRPMPPDATCYAVMIAALPADFCEIEYEADDEDDFDEDAPEISRYSY